jgi:hypothetical protein
MHSGNDHVRWRVRKKSIVLMICNSLLHILSCVYSVMIEPRGLLSVSSPAEHLLEALHGLRHSMLKTEDGL